MASFSSPRATGITGLATWLWPLSPFAPSGDYSGPRPARFSAFPPRPKAALQHAREFFSETRTLHLSHNPLGALMAYNIWLTILAMGVTGYMMGTVRFFGLDWVEELHELAFNWLLLSIALHLLGVLVETKLSGVSLVKAMLDGRKRIPDGGKVVE